MQMMDISDLLPLLRTTARRIDLYWDRADIAGNPPAFWDHARANLQTILAAAAAEGHAWTVTEIEDGLGIVIVLGRQSAPALPAPQVESASSPRYSTPG